MHQNNTSDVYMQHMEKGSMLLFKQARHSPEDILADEIWKNIQNREARKARLVGWTYAVVGFFSFIALIPVIRELFTELKLSGFSKYFSLIFSDWNSIIKYWKEFVFSLADALPLTAIAITLSLAFIALVSFRRAAKRIKIKAFVTA